MLDLNDAPARRPPQPKPALSSGPPLAPDQLRAVLAIVRWGASPTGGRFLLAGDAGTGKTTVIRAACELLEARGVRIQYLSPTGKAASRLREKGCTDAKTIHAFMHGLRRGAKLPDLLVVDEASMVAVELWRDLANAAFPAPLPRVLAVGDEKQLQPVGDPECEDAVVLSRPEFDLANADARLTTNYRQRGGGDSALVVRLAQHVIANPDGWATSPIRTRESWTDGALPILHAGSLSPQAVFADVDVVLAYSRKDCDDVNRLIHRSRQLAQGDKLVCFQNNYRAGVFNGERYTVDRVYSESKIRVTLESECPKTIDVEIFDPFVSATAERRWGQGARVDFRLGYCLTVHKAQGSEWGTVAVLATSLGAQTMPGWAYTAVTRARNEVVVFV